VQKTINMSDVMLRPLVQQLRDALMTAEGELQRRCFISAEIREALAAADAFLNGGRAQTSNRRASLR
jgi:hypothetical protein